MDHADDMRPKGTVEVMCRHPGCGTAWWVDPLDPRLPGGPWDCGADHDANRRVRPALARLHLRYGLEAGIQVARGAEAPGGSCCSRSFRKGNALVHSRDWLRMGFLSWEDPAELADAAALAARVEWDRAKWPEEMRTLAAGRERAPAGSVSWVGYQMPAGDVRRYTFVPCARPDCGHELMVDLARPDFRAEGYSVGGYGGGFARKPAWWGTRTFRCEDGLSSFSPMPCRLRLAPALAVAERQWGAQWTVWSILGRERGSVLFATPGSEFYGLLAYEREDVFETFESLHAHTTWWTLEGLRDRLGARLKPDEWDRALGVVDAAIRGVS